MHSYDPIDSTLSRLHSRTLLTCDPVSATVGVAAVSGGLQYIGANNHRQLLKGTENQKEIARQEQIDSNNVRANAAYLAQVTSETVKQDQEHQSDAERTNDNTKRLTAASSTADVAAAEGNVAGNNLDSIKSDYQMQTDIANGRLATNQQWVDYAHTRNDIGFGVTLQDRESAIQPYQKQVFAPADPFGAIFRTAGAGLQASNNSPSSPSPVASGGGGGNPFSATIPSDAFIG